MHGVTICKKCNFAVQIVESECPSCGTQAGFPNVKIAEAERDALLNRAARARESAKREGVDDLLSRLEQLAASTHAVVNCSSDFVHYLLCSDAPLYHPYRQLVESGQRRPAALQHDRRRTEVESALYGSNGEMVIYAALSTNGHGLSSYGPISLQLKEETIDHRASVLEENSYKFAERHALKVIGPVPAGFMGTWPDRSEVAVAKLACKLCRGLDPNVDLDELILRSTGSRDSDEFLEVHIWGRFGRGALARISVSDPLENTEALLFAELAQEKAQKCGIPWTWR